MDSKTLATLAFLDAFGAEQSLLTYFADLSGPGLPYMIDITFCSDLAYRTRSYHTRSLSLHVLHMSRRAAQEGFYGKAQSSDNCYLKASPCRRPHFWASFQGPGPLPRASARPAILISLIESFWRAIGAEIDHF